MNPIRYLAGWTVLCLSACAITPAPSTGALLFAEHCVVCHGRTAQGDGPAAASLGVRPPNLRVLTRQNGGVFPRNDVIAQIYGYSGRDAFGGMPAFGRELEGPLIDLVSASGEVTPTPRALIELADYLESIQR